MKTKLSWPGSRSPIAPVLVVCGSASKYSAGEDQLLPEIQPAGPRATRLRKAAAFVAIVWGVAASFVAFEVVATRGFDFVLARPQWFGPLLLSRSTRDSKACEVSADEAGTGAKSGLSASEARMGAWMLGLRVGRDAQARQSTTVNPEVLTASAVGIEQLASILDTPAPGSFSPERVIGANTEFVTFVDTDARSTAHRIAVSYSPEACHLYKLGAVWGYATLARFALPGSNAVFAVEIHHYATRTGLPEDLWRPMVERIPSNATAEQLNAQSIALTKGVTDYLVNPR